MIFDELFAQRVSTHRAGYGFTQAQLAEKVGVTPRQIAAYEGGQSKPRPAVLMRLAKAFGVSPEFLAGGSGIYEDQSAKGVKVKISESLTGMHDPKFKSNIPLISKESIADWLNSAKHDEVKVFSRHYSHLPISNLAFALIIDEPSMAASDAFGFGIPRKSLVVFEPCIDAEDQDFVLALMPDGGTLFRQYFSGYSGGALHALDARYSPEKLGDYVDEDNNAPMLIPAISYEAYFPASERLQEL